MKQDTSNIQLTCFLGTQKLRWENAVLKRKLRTAWLAIWALVALVMIVLGFAMFIAGGAR